METHILLFDAECPQCSSVAKRVRELAINDLEVRSLTDPAMIDLFAREGQPVPTKPALVQLGGRRITVRTGFRMRMGLAKLLGPRRAADIIALLGMEAKARAERRGGAIRPMSRRSLLGGAVAGAAAGAGALVFGAAAPAAAQAGQSSSPLTGALTGDSLRRVAGSAALREATAAWGAARMSDALTAVTPGGTNIALVPHEGSEGAFSVIDIEGDNTAITLVADSSSQSLRYYLPSGTALAEVTVQGGEVISRPLAEAESLPDSPQPEGVREFTVCFVGCLGVSVDVGCVSNCIACAIGGVLQKAIYCPQCIVCAGSAGVDCANGCRDLL